MKLRIEKSTAKGVIAAPPSKSMAHRLLICAAMCEGQSTVRGVSDCEDVQATLDCLDALGVETLLTGEDVVVNGKDFRNITPSGPLKCRESGSTLRFMIPTALLCGKPVIFQGEKQLMKRPMGVYEKLFREKGLVFTQEDGTITVKGVLTGGDYNVVGNVSSQFISGLLFALPLAQGDSLIKITPPIESRSYIDLTLNALKLFGIEAGWQDDYTIYIKGNQQYTPTDVTVEGDYSGAVFPDSLNLFGGDVEVTGLNPKTIQGDSVYRKYFDMLKNGVATIHIGDCPDLGPILFAVAAAKHGGVFSGTKRLKIKESDRTAAMAMELKKFGVSVSVYEDEFVVYPSVFHAPEESLYGHNDHRIVMALAVLLSLTGGEIEGAEAVSKSYPGFFRHLQSLGIGVTEV